MKIEFSPKICIQQTHWSNIGYRLLWLKLRGSSQFHQPNAGTVTTANNTYTFTHILTYTYTHSMHMCVCVCVRVRVRGRLSRYWICFRLRGKWMQLVSPEIIWPTFDAMRPEQDWLCTHYVTLRRVRATVVHVEKQLLRWVCVCSLRYPACNAHAPYCHLSSVWLYNIFPYYLINGTIFEKKRLFSTKSILIFAINSVWNVSNIKKNRVKYHKCTLGFT